MHNTFLEQILKYFNVKRGHIFAGDEQGGKGKNSSLCRFKHPGEKAKKKPPLHQN